MHVCMFFVFFPQGQNSSINCESVTYCQSKSTLGWEYKIKQSHCENNKPLGNFIPLLWKLKSSRAVLMDIVIVFYLFFYFGGLHDGMKAFFFISVARSHLAYWHLAAEFPHCLAKDAKNSAKTEWIFISRLWLFKAGSAL